MNLKTLKLGTGKTPLQPSLQKHHQPPAPELPRTLPAPPAPDTVLQFQRFHTKILLCTFCSIPQTILFAIYDKDLNDQSNPLACLFLLPLSEESGFPLYHLQVNPSGMVGQFYQHSSCEQQRSEVQPIQKPAAEKLSSLPTDSPDHLSCFCLSILRAIHRTQRHWTVYI